jgi:hypothetical protein
MDFPILCVALVSYGTVVMLEKQPLLRAGFQRRLAMKTQKEHDAADFEYVRDDYSEQNGLYNEFTDQQLIEMGVELDTTLQGPRPEEASAEFKPAGWSNYQQTAQFSAPGRHVPFAAFKLQ